MRSAARSRPHERSDDSATNAAVRRFASACSWPHSRLWSPERARPAGACVERSHLGAWPCSRHFVNTTNLDLPDAVDSACSRRGRGRMDHTDQRIVPFSIRRHQHGDHEYERRRERRDVSQRIERLGHCDDLLVVERLAHHRRRHRFLGRRLSSSLRDRRDVPTASTSRTSRRTNSATPSALAIRPLRARRCIRPCRRARQGIARSTRMTSRAWSPSIRPGRSPFQQRRRASASFPEDATQFTPSEKKRRSPKR